MIDDDWWYWWYWYVRRLRTVQKNPWFGSICLGSLFYLLKYLLLCTIYIYTSGLVYFPCYLLPTWFVLITYFTLPSSQTYPAPNLFTYLLTYWAVFSFCYYWLLIIIIIMIIAISAPPGINMECSICCMEESLLLLLLLLLLLHARTVHVRIFKNSTW